jgi:N-acetylglucosaminyldiphosphoundecaprenol N-acetyl-beta-D-mannosaminyltransferase
MTLNRPLAHLKISTGTLDQILSYIEECIAGDKRIYCIPLNVTKYVLSKKDSKLREVINDSDLVIADGIPIMWLSRRVGYGDVYRVTGIDLAETILSRSKKNMWKLFFLGASSENLERAIKRVCERFDHPDIVGYENGYFKPDDVDKVIDKIISSKADILFLGLGMPQKEYFIRDYFAKTTARFYLPVGGAFDIWAEVKKRTPKVVQKIGMEWFYRSFYDVSRARNIARYGLNFFGDFIFCKRR